MPSNLLIAAVTAFRNLVNNIQGTDDPGQRLQQTTASLSEVANVLERLATTTATNEQQFSQMNQQFNQMDQRLGQTVQQVQDAFARRIDPERLVLIQVGGDGAVGSR